ncbi:MAG: DUF6476 family protein [Stellaceae bacterium]
MAAKLALKMRALKLLVIILGVLLLAGIVTLATAVVWRIDHGHPATAPKPMTAPAAQRVVLPAGAKIVAIDVAAGRLVARVDMAGGGVHIFVFDLATGAEIATIELVPTSP